MIKITVCPTCGSRKIRKVRKNMTRELRGEAYTVPNVEFYECPDCGEHVFDPQASRKIDAHSPAYKRSRHRTPQHKGWVSSTHPLARSLETLRRQSREIHRPASWRQHGVAAATACARVYLRALLPWGAARRYCTGQVAGQPSSRAARNGQ